MNDKNRIADVDLNTELLDRINNPSNAVDVILKADLWTTNDMISEVPEGLEYMYIYPIQGVVSSSFVNAIFDHISKELAMDYGVYSDIIIDKDQIIFFSEEKPSEDLGATVYYIK